MSRGATFTSETPHFFKIILQETLREKRLLIPRKFVRLYGETLSDTVTVKLQCGSQWKMKLMKREGKVWLEKGWTRFAEHCSIALGHMVVFRYGGNSEFEAVVFDTSTVEIDYPVAPSRFDEAVAKGKRKAGEEEDDGSVEILEDFAACHGTGKRMRASPLDKSDISSSRAEHNGARRDKAVLENSESKGDCRDCETEGKQGSGCSSSGLKSSTTSRKSSKRIRFGKPLNRSEKTAALEKASGFASDRPFFKVVMQRCYVRGGNFTNFPASFARRYLKDKPRNAVLEVPNGERKTWPVKHSLVDYASGKSVARLTCGWREFAQDNNLEVGDVCVFVLLEAEMVSFEVSIFRANENSGPPNSPALLGEATRLDDREENSTSESETSVPSSCDDLPEQQENNSAPSFIETSIVPDATAGRQSLTKIQKNRLLEKAHFVSKRPFFKVVMQPSYTDARSHMPIPLDFSKRFIKSEGDIMALRVPNSGSWSVQFKVLRLKSGQATARFCCGWSAFAAGNNLAAGDVCIFELVDGTAISFDVHIVRTPGGGGFSPGSRACDSPIATPKPEGDERVIIEID